MGPQNRWFVALTLVIAMLSLAGPGAPARSLAAAEDKPAIESPFSADSSSALVIDSGTGELPEHEQTMSRVTGVVTALEEDDSDAIGDGHHFVVVRTPTLDPTRRRLVKDLADEIRPVIARGWRALPCERGPPAA